MRILARMIGVTQGLDLLPGFDFQREGLQRTLSVVEAGDVMRDVWFPK